jgi:predicted secreted protein
LIRYLQYGLLGLAGVLWIAQLFLPDDGVGFVTGAVVYLIVWWMVFFMILPLSVQSQHEAGEVVPGSDEGAPTDPRLRWKMWITSVITAGLWLIYFVAFEFQLVSLDMIPVGPSPAGLAAS